MCRCEFCGQVCKEVVIETQDGRFCSDDCVEEAERADLEPVGASKHRDSDWD